MLEYTSPLKVSISKRGLRRWDHILSQAPAARAPRCTEHVSICALWRDGTKIIVGREVPFEVVCETNLVDPSG